MALPEGRYVWLLSNDKCPRWQQYILDHSWQARNTSTTTPRCASHASKAMGYLSGTSLTVEVELSTHLKLNFVPDRQRFMRGYRSHLTVPQIDYKKRSTLVLPVSCDGRNAQVQPRITAELRYSHGFMSLQWANLLRRCNWYPFRTFIHFWSRSSANLLSVYLENGAVLWSGPVEIL